MPNAPKNATVIPEICVDDARSAIAFYQQAFGAKDLGTHATPDGKRIMHSGLSLNGSVVFVRDDFPERQGGKARTPKALGGSPVTIHLNCAAVQRAWDTAVEAGASVVLPLAKQFWGDTYGVLVDPFGQPWSMSGSHSEKLDTKSTEYVAGAKELYPTGKGKPSSRASTTKPKPTKPKARRARGR